MRKGIPLLAAVMIFSLSACGSPATAGSVMEVGKQSVAFYDNEKLEDYIDPGLLVGVTEDGDDYILLSESEPNQMTDSSGYAVTALSAQPNLSLLVPHSSEQIARNLTQDAEALSKLTPNVAIVARLAPNSTDIAQMAPNPLDNISDIAFGAGIPIPGMSKSGSPAIRSDRDIVSDVDSVIVAPDEVLTVAPNAGVSQCKDSNGAAQAVTPDGQDIIGVVQAIENDDDTVSHEK